MVSDPGNLRFFVLVLVQIRYEDITGQECGQVKQEGRSFYNIRGSVRVAV